jgi:hypothetical protein
MRGIPSRRRWVACVAIAVQMAGFAACRGVRPAAREAEVATPTPTPSATPRKPRRTPAPRPTPTVSPPPAPTPMGGAVPFSAATRDLTREPLTRTIDERTPAPLARSMEAAERARIELQSGTTGRAIELADEAIRLSPTSVAPWVVRARALLAEGSVELARADLEHAQTLSPDASWMAEIVAMSGATYEAEGRTDLALASYRRAVVIFPANQTARDGLRRLSGP